MNQVEDHYIVGDILQEHAWWQFLVISVDRLHRHQEHRDVHTITLLYTGIPLLLYASDGDHFPFIIFLRGNSRN
jgi:hypothetical protein